MGSNLLQASGALCGLFALALVATPAEAKDDKDTLGGIDLTIGLQVGTGTELGTSVVDVYNLLFTGHAGVTIPVGLPLYLGVRGDYFGGTSALGLNINGNTFDVDQNATQITGELGIEPKLGPLRFRPTVGVGAATIRSQVCNADAVIRQCDPEPGGGLAANAALQVGVTVFKSIEVTAFARINQISGTFDLDLSNAAGVYGAGLAARF